ncbi:MAG TPA: hypothetical protein VNS32_22495 [Flavisolibacter sp.]|nr:hypothetical protein [Flavisolibacter sp.]
MTSEDFVKGFYLEKEKLLKIYFSPDPKTQVGLDINSLNPTKEQKAKLKSILDGALTDMCYTILLGLDGEAQIGGIQEMYRLYDENGNELTDDEIEGYAWEYFHNQK